MDGQPASESLRKGILAIQTGDSRWFQSSGYPIPLVPDYSVSELAYLFVGLAPSRIYSRKLRDTDRFDVRRHRYNIFYNLSFDWIDNNKPEPQILVNAFKDLSNDYLDELKESGNDDQVADLYFKLATLCFKTGGIKEAVEYGDKSVKVSEKLASNGDRNSNLKLANVLYNACKYYGDCGDLSVVHSVLNQLELMSNNFDQDKDINLAFANGNLIGLFLMNQMKNDIEAIKYLERISEIADKFPDDREIQNIYSQALDIMYRENKKSKF